MSSYFKQQHIIYSIDPDAKYWALDASSWVKQVYQLQNDADIKTALLDSNIIIEANEMGLLPSTLSAFEKIKMNYQIIFEEIKPNIGHDVKLFLGGSLKNIEISYDSVSDTFDKASCYSDITATTTSNNSSAADASCLISAHSLKHLGDGWLLSQTAIIGREQSFVLTDERKNFKQDLDNSQIVSYSFWHILLLLLSIKETKLMDKDKLADIYFKLGKLSGICIHKNIFNKILGLFKIGCLSIR